jgi:DNA helicase-2/ATP-dependent DNA helicase PcrA
MDFDREYAKLNPTQKLAVNATEGAVLVIAGPGTGKTQLLSMRVATILRTTDTLPGNILCLTFTNKAALNMQQRLTRLIGSTGQKVMIKTFHSFAAEIMNLYPQYFWNGAALANVPDAVQLEIITDILSGLPLDNPLALKFAGQFTAVKSVLGALKESKEAGLTPDKLRTLIRANLSYIDEVEEQLVDICAERLSYKTLDELALQIDELPEQATDELTRPLISLSTVIREDFEKAHSLDEGTSKTKNTGDWKRRWLQSVDGQKGMHAERERNEWWLKLADVYEAYRGVLHERGYYDYSDMIIEVIAQLEQKPDMRADAQERFQYVLIDEFQDTNAAQLRLAHLVADHPVAESNPNIMAVGDDDQSIYKFNGAELSNMRSFKRSYPATREFVLTGNYRSSQAVLDFSAQVIEQVAERLTSTDPSLSKVLVAKNPPGSKSTIRHTIYPTKEHEYYGLAERIASVKASGGSVAVLARGHDSLKAVAHTLHQAGVPIRYEQSENILLQPMIVEISYICEIIVALAAGDEPTVNRFLPQLLAHKAWQISPLELWQLALKNRYQPHWIESLLASKNQQAETIAHWLLWLALETETEPLPRILELVIGLSASEHLTSPLRRYYLEANAIDTPYLASISAARKLLGLAQEFCEQGEATVASFVRLLHVSEDNGRSITDESLFVTADDAVELLSIHKAKGLEFDSVFVVDAQESVWKPKTTGRRPPANLPLKPSGDDFDDYVRLMFVAVTRAKRDIYISSYAVGAAGEEVLPSAIIRDILPGTVIDYKRAGDPTTILESALRWPRLEGSEETELLKHILDDYALSPSAYLDFLDVAKGGPQYFLAKHLLKLPEAATNSAAFGSAVHSALERAQQLVSEGSFELGAVLTSYEKALAQQQLSQVDFDRYLIHGQQVISRLFEDYGVRLLPSGWAEAKLTLTLEGAKLSGKLDRLDIDPETLALTITDYKTGNPLSSFQTRNKVIQIKAWRHRTQLQLYALMVQASGQYKYKGPVTTQMMYVEAETDKDLTRQLVPEVADLDRLTKLVGIVYERITTHNLPDVRHYSEDFDGIHKFENDLLSGTI